jgi:hypothetical protein
LLLQAGCCHLKQQYAFKRWCLVVQQHDMSRGFKQLAAGLLRLVAQAAEAAAVYDTGIMQDNANGITSANLLTASKDEDLVF